MSSLDTNKTGLLNELQSRTTGPGRAYVLKLMLPWLLPRVERAIVLDFDLWVREPLERLAREFDAFARRHMVGVVPDIAAPALPRLASRRQRGRAADASAAHARGGVGEDAASPHRVGGIPRRPDRARAPRPPAHRPRRRLSCRYNRQLNTHFWLPTSAYTCADGCAIVHGNQPRFKRAVRLAVDGDVSALAREVPARIAPALADCFVAPFGAPVGRNATRALSRARNVPAP